MCTPLARSDYYGASAPSHGHQPTTDIAPDAGQGARLGATEDGSHVHHMTDRPGRCPALPRQHRHRLRRRPSAWPPHRSGSPASESTPQSSEDRALHPGPDPPDLEPVQPLRGFNHWFTRVTPSGLACRTRLVWQYRAVPTLSGLLATLPGVPRLRLPPASIGLLRQPNGEGVTPPLGHAAPRGAHPGG
jgi:hypothetical protein